MSHNHEGTRDLSRHMPTSRAAPNTIRRTTARGQRLRRPSSRAGSGRDTLQAPPQTIIERRSATPFPGPPPVVPAEEVYELDVGDGPPPFTARLPVDHSELGRWELDEYSSLDNVLVQRRDFVRRRLVQISEFALRAPVTRADFQQSATYLNLATHLIHSHDNRTEYLRAFYGDTRVIHLALARLLDEWANAEDRPISDGIRGELQAHLDHQINELVEPRPYLRGFVARRKADSS